MKKIAVLAVVLAAAAGGTWLYADSQFYDNCEVEAGADFSPSRLLKNEDPNASYAEGSETVDVHVPGEYKVKVKSGWLSHKGTVIVKDTTAPQLNAKDMVQLVWGEQCEAGDFLENVTDETAVTLSFAEEPDFQKMGEQTVKITAVDLGGNQASAETTLAILPVYPTLVVEAGGDCPTASDYVVKGDEYRMLSDLSEIDMDQEGTYQLELKVDKVEYTVNLEVRDTTAPQVEIKEVHGFTDTPVEAEDFVVSCEDAGEVTMSFAAEPDYSREGEQDVALVFADPSGNKTELTGKLYLEKDTEPPVISGAEDMQCTIGNTISFRQAVKVTDNSGKDVELTVDTSKLNQTQEGTYPVTYTATDASGNTSSKTINVTMVASVYSEAAVNKLADKVLDKILTSGMTQKQKAEAIFDYTKYNIRYTGSASEDDVFHAAYEGLVDQRGNCYTYASTAQVLLTRAGINNTMIHSIPNSHGDHYWNIINLGDGWYHFDTTPRVNDRRFFMWTDDKIQEYSKANNGCHDYDHSKYPEVVKN